MRHSYRHKFQLSFRLFLDIFRFLPVRMMRLLLHVFGLGSYLVTPFQHGMELGLPRRMFLWLGELLLFVLDIPGLPEWYELFNCWGKLHSRPLNGREMALVRTVFEDHLPYYRIQLDEWAHFGPKQYRFCYVSFCIVNSWDSMAPAILIHEMVHVWQFRQYGSPYLLRALLAQHTPEGYDYGGMEKLRRAQRNNAGLAAFNYEQQAAIIEDFFRLRHIQPTRWSPSANKQDLETYRFFVKAMLSTAYKS